MLKELMIRSTLIAIVSSVSYAAHAMAEPPKPVDVPSGNLVPALEALAKQEAVELLYQPEQLKSFHTQGVKGSYTPQDAVRLLLKGTPLELRTDPSGAMVISAPGTAVTSSSTQTPSPPDDSSSRSSLQLAQATPGQTSNDVSVEKKDEEEKKKKEELQEVVVTGTHIRGTDPVGSPVLSYSREDIRRTGVATINDFINLLPQNFTGGPNEGTAQVQAQNSGGNLSGGVAANLRGLGPGTTLTLLNGHRLATEDNTFVDLSMIPLAAIERVEILTDGASAIYGSDAIGGVVNIILRKDLQGAETTGRFGADLKGGVKENQATQSIGFDWNGGGALASYEFYHRDMLSAYERSFASQTQDPTTGLLDPNAFLLPDQRRNSIFMTANQDITSRIKVNGDGFYSLRDAAVNGLGLFNTTVSKVEQFGASLSADFDVGAGWNVQVAPSFGENRFRTYTEQPDASLPLHSTSRDRVTEIDIKGDGPILTLPAGLVRIATGVSYRSENSSQVVPIDQTFSDIGRSVKAVFAELSIPAIGADNALPLAKRLDLSVAARYDHYSDFGATTNPKFGLRYSPATALQLRGSFSRSYRAPNLQDLQEIPALYLFGLPTANGTELLLDNGGSGNAHLGPETARNWTAGFDLTPTALPLRVSATYYNVSYKGIIEVPDQRGPVDLLNNASVYPSDLVLNPSASFVNGIIATNPSAFQNFTGGPFNPANVYAYINEQIQNIAAETQRGVDLTTSYDLRTSAGQFNLNVDATRILNCDRQVTLTSREVSFLNRFELPIAWKGRAQVAWSLGPYGAVVAANYQGHYIDDVAAPPTPLSSWTTVDGQISYRAQRSSPSDWLSGVSLVLNVSNIFDTDPPFTLSSFDHSGYDHANASPLGRFLSVELSKRW